MLLISQGDKYMTIPTIEKIYHKYRVPLFRYFYKMGGDYHLAEELTQETFYRATYSLNGFRGDSAISTWLFRIAFFVYSGHQRSRSREVDLVEGDYIPDSRRLNDPARALDEAESQRLMLHILDELPPDYRAVIILREVESLSFDEIGQVLNKSPATARVTLFRARQKYRQIYIKLTEGDDQ